ncbi:hypothetical protein MPDQ_001470 [Monascus purpureus]|uniref:SGNH hydrolase-type esterase domain-containing protein n=1 Tax=Monascus purpureus TaxID=5098 RepID=A0A507R3V7_MONPU|nr:hypothetical protein MPDQ_001470 [Monascus purpureus]
MNPTHSRSAVDKEAPTTNSVTATIAPRTGPPHGLELRILPVGASITVGYRSNENGGDGNGYRLQLFKDLSHDYHVIFAGTRSQGTMKDGYFAAWTGRTIEEIEKLVPPSLQQRPNIILIHAGTNDMSSNPKIAQQGNTPNGAVERLGNLIDECVAACPDATVLVAQIIHTCRKDGSEQRIEEFNSLIPGVVGKRVAAGHHVMAVNLQSFPLDQLHQDDCIHPTNKGYKTLGSMWARAIRTIPEDWVKAPVGHDPVRASGKAPSLNIPCLPWMVVWMAVSYFILKLEAIGS